MHSSASASYSVNGGVFAGIIQGFPTPVHISPYGHATARASLELWLKTETGGPGFLLVNMNADNSVGNGSAMTLINGVMPGFCVVAQGCFAIGVLVPVDLGSISVLMTGTGQFSNSTRLEAFQNVGGLQAVGLIETTPEPSSWLLGLAATGAITLKRWAKAG